MDKEVQLNSFAGKNKVLFTIGYEGMDIANFLEKLSENKVNVLIDVRELPLSRKKGFSKASLRENLGKKGIAYLHFKELGSPKELRKELYRSRDFGSFFDKFEDYLKTKGGVLEDLHKKILNEKSCLMCFEKDFEFCHRSILTKEIRRIDNNGLKVINL